MGMLTPTLKPNQTAICGQEFNASIPAAPSVYVPYTFCKAKCDGPGISQFAKPSAWAAPIVQFILPAVIFSTTIPRRLKLGFKSQIATTPGRGQTAKRWLTFISTPFKGPIRLFLVVADNVFWIAAILMMAGPMMLSGVYEAVLDLKILAVLDSDPGQNFDEATVVELLLTVVAGNLHRSAQIDPLADIQQAIRTSVTAEAKRARLLGLVDSQMPYGAIVGAPVAFYIGNFVYTILDLKNKPSDQDAAISLAFGVEWMIIVHVAIIGSCVLATNNPSTSSVLSGRGNPRIAIRRATTTQNLAGQLPPGLWTRIRTGDLPFLVDMYDNRYQPVTMWSRGNNKEEWVRNSAAYRVQLRDNRRLMVGWMAKISILFVTAVLINLPLIAGAVVAWRTPPVGWGCRSLSFICYAGVQLLVTMLFIVLHKVPTPNEVVRGAGPAKGLKRYLGAGWYLIKVFWCGMAYAVFGVSLLLSLFVALGGTLMQVVGIYRNCFCYVNAPEWYNTDRAYVQVASDTQEQRDSSHNWIIFGGIATLFMAACCLVGWWYQARVRRRYKRIVNSRLV
ncbi:hypothetical protein PV08_03904 [Exophiala spinifera]|uniref:Uncharacterized protein n=1 Tax=Exophiala spinifera TaxID=91928 RepID=A0A0D2BDL3_9EURO|nr:uncharacterized protein PV08_03904 [Exophiala spinifera]KIW16715.1 hypothetical protein PV08_03904 [Exophiala spinifera]